MDSSQPTRQRSSAPKATSRPSPGAPRLSDAVERLRFAGVERPVLEAQILLALAANTSRVEVMRGAVTAIGWDAARRFERLVAERCRRVPLAYLRGTQEFYGLEFEVTAAVLIPRPETELLVDLVVERSQGPANSPIIDVGTGTGCIAIAAAKGVRGARFAGVDASADALKIAANNVRRHGMADRILLVRGDLLEPFAEASAAMIVSNPPYISSDEIAQLQPEVSRYEPRAALDGGPCGLAFYRRLAPEAMRVLRSGGLLAVEVGRRQADPVARLFNASGLRSLEARRDLAGIERVVIGRR